MFTILVRVTITFSSICPHPSKIGGRSQIARSSQVRMTIRMDTSSTTQMTEILGKHGRFCGISQTKFIWTCEARSLTKNNQSTCTKNAMSIFWSPKVVMGLSRVGKQNHQKPSLETRPKTMTCKFGFVRQLLGFARRETGKVVAKHESK